MLRRLRPAPEDLAPLRVPGYRNLLAGTFAVHADLHREDASIPLDRDEVLRSARAQGADIRHPAGGDGT